MTQFPSQVYANRLTEARALARTAGTPLIITPGPDLAYLTGIVSQSFERLTALVVSENGFGLVLPRLELAILNHSAVPDLGTGGVEVTIADWVDGDDPYASVMDLLGTPAPSTVAIDDAMPALHLVPLLDRGLRVALATGVLRRLRMIKDEAEIAQLRAAGAAIDRVHARVPQILRAGRTEREVAEEISAAIVEEGHTEAAFVIVGSGPHGADPHHEVSDRMIESGDVVVVDIGGPLPSGYNSDCTRTYSIGEPAPDVAAKYAELERAQQASVDAVRPGVSAQSIDAAGREVLESAGLGEYFVHRTGHGIGLSVHEEPYIVAGNDIPVEVGMAFSIEPGVYEKGRWGARIEDIVIVTENGCESVNNRPHGLTIV
ncbi:Xaa-Pro peptidase family protein [Tsukamurella serpentis]